MSLRDTQSRGLVITEDGETVACDLWSGEPSALERASRSALPYAPLCDGRLYLRNPVAGHRTDLERVAEFLRDHVWRGEEIVGFVRDQLLGDAYLERAIPGLAAGAVGEPRALPGGRRSVMPTPIERWRPNTSASRSWARTPVG